MPHHRSAQNFQVDLRLVAQIGYGAGDVAPIQNRKRYLQDQGFTAHFFANDSLVPDVLSEIQKYCALSLN